jgi:hypothetical protein
MSLIVEHIKSIKFDYLDSIVDAENKYFFFKRLLFNSINLFAPLKLVKIKKKVQKSSLIDNELMKLRRKCDKLFSMYKKSSSVFDKQLYDNVKTNYQKR